MTTWQNRLTGTVGTDLSVANSTAGGDAFSFVIKGASSTAKYATLPWGGTGAALVISGSSDATYVRWDDKSAGNTATRGLVVFPVWLSTIPTNAVNLAQIRDTSGSSSMAALNTSSSTPGKIVAAQQGGSVVAATLSTMTLAANHLYWIGLAVSKGAAGSGVIEWIIWDSDRMTVLESKVHSTATTSTASPGEFRVGAPASATNVPRTHYLSDVQAGHYASGWPEPIADPTPVVAPIASQEVEPGELVTVTASLASGSASTWTWTQTSGPAVTLNPSGSTVTFTSPKPLPPGNATIALSVTADDSDPVTATIAVRPHLTWSRQPGQSWVPSSLIA